MLHDLANDGGLCCTQTGCKDTGIGGGGSTAVYSASKLHKAVTLTFHPLLSVRSEVLHFTASLGKRQTFLHSVQCSNSIYFVSYSVRKLSQYATNQVSSTSRMFPANDNHWCHGRLMLSEDVLAHKPCNSIGHRVFRLTSTVTHTHTHTHAGDYDI